jgi:uncharacterized protein DUF6931
MATTTAPESAVRPPTAAVLAPSLAWLISRVSLDDEAQAAVREVAPGALADGASDAGALAAALLRAERPADALRLVACALPPREGVWWAFVAAQHASQLTLDPPVVVTPAVSAALAAVERWVKQPDEEARRGAWAAADAAGMETAAGAAAAAAFFTGGSVAPAGVASVPPPAGLHCTLAGAAVLVAAASDPAHFAPLVEAYLNQGLEIIKHLGGWDVASAQARQHFDAQAELHASAVGASKGAAAPAPAPAV